MLDYANLFQFNKAVRSSHSDVFLVTGARAENFETIGNDEIGH